MLSRDFLNHFLQLLTRLFVIFLQGFFMNKNNSQTSANIRQTKPKTSDNYRNIYQGKRSNSVEMTLEILRILERNKKL